MVKFTPFTIDATHLIYNTIFNERTGNSLNSTYINTQQTLNRIKHLTQQDFQTPSNFNNEEIVETIPSKIQQSISPFHPTLTTTHKKNTPFPQTTIQSTVKSSVVPKKFRNGLPNIRLLTKTQQPNKQKPLKRNKFSNHNYR